MYEYNYCKLETCNITCIKFLVLFTIFLPKYKNDDKYEIKIGTENKIDLYA